MSQSLTHTVYIRGGQLFSARGPNWEQIWIMWSTRASINTKRTNLIRLLRQNQFLEVYFLNRSILIDI